MDNMLRMANPSHAAARLLISMLFLTSGIGKLGAIEPTQKYMEAYGVPGYLVYPAAALEIGSGVMLVIGMQLHWLGQILAGWCMLTAMIFHTDFSDQNQKINFLKNMAMTGGFLVLSAIALPEKGHPATQSINGTVFTRLTAGVIAVRSKLFGRPGGDIALPVTSWDPFVEKAVIMDNSSLPSYGDDKAKGEIEKVLYGYRDAVIRHPLPT